MTEPSLRAVPKTAMVFAAGLGTRMRPITETLPKPLVKVGGRALIDYCLDRLAEDGVETAIVNVHWLADQIEAHLAARRQPRIVISDERDRLLDQGGGIKRVLPLIGPRPFLVCNTDAFWIEGPRSNLKRLAAAFDPEIMDILLLVAGSATAVGVDWPGDFTMTHDGRLVVREPRHVAPFVYTGVGIMKPQLFEGEPRDVFRLAPFFHSAAESGRLFGLRLDGLWIHVGRPESIAEAERAIDRSIL
jgi:N-acetyl-alpha-D-muramate 1-phosphate uridylyltransferase